MLTLTNILQRFNGSKHKTKRFELSSGTWISNLRYSYCYWSYNIEVHNDIRWTSFHMNLLNKVWNDYMDVLPRFPRLILVYYVYCSCRMRCLSCHYIYRRNTSISSFQTISFCSCEVQTIYNLLFKLNCDCEVSDC